MLSVKQGSIKYHFLSLWYDSTWDWTQVSRAIGAGFNLRSSHTKDFKMELDTTLLNTQHYKVRFKGKVEQSREWSSALPYTLV